ncbi:flagellar basal-body rod modification protein FlgD [Litoreibacter halocynthiae]|uniref:Basal-body rod modification protein FlgD n=1 Tax=Litoreibacter halocynthiae TaxID=1242689 RepID=A0A4R7LGS5_9RHOB|nr:flagellar hook capping FlgD N-terminal domain-containing protein [Litoreibacter halocynthiae]TDT73842.1 flagellar basal-body rod modification protein FlgD [Litoreibacter halocynthiae]
MDAITPTSTTTQAQAANKATSSVISSDFETFLVMLTAQMENQDPLNPLDSQDFATQLATFSGVEQQVKTNDLLSALTSQLLVSSMGDMASWVGMEARMAVPAHFSGAPIEIVSNPPNFAERAVLVIKNESGTEVQRIEVPVSDEPMHWAGVADNGQPFAQGTYSFEIEAYSNDALIDTHIPDVFARVSEIRTIDQTAVVVLEGGTIYPANSVTGLR